MEHNFTPLDITKFQKPSSSSDSKKDGFWTVFLLLGFITLLIIAVLLFILIQKKLTNISFVSYPLLTIDIPTYG